MDPETTETDTTEVITPDPAETGTDDGASTASTKVTFTDEQQAAVNKAIDRAVGRARREATAALEAERAKFADYEQLKEGAAKAGDLLRKLDDVTRAAAIRLAAVVAGAVNPDQVIALIDPAAVTVTDGVAANADQVVSDFLSANPHFVTAPPVRVPGSINGGENSAATPGIDEQIAAAYARGDHKLAASLKTQKFLAQQHNRTR